MTAEKFASDSLCSTLACVNPLVIASEERTSTQEDKLQGNKLNCGALERTRSTNYITSFNLI